MHPNPAFRKTPTEQNVEFARERSFGTLAVNSENAPLISHVPFLLSPDGRYVEMHLVRSNPIVRLLKDPIEAVVAVTSSDAYVSPDWYGVENQVPTWNYVAVHLRGQLRLLDQNELHGVLERLSAHMEERLTPKAPWKIVKMDTEVYAKMQRQIVPIALQVSDIQGTWKLSQNKSDEVRKAAAAGLRNGSVGVQVGDLAGLMERIEVE